MVKIKIFGIAVFLLSFCVIVSCSGKTETGTGKSSEAYEITVSEKSKPQKAEETLNISNSDTAAPDLQTKDAEDAIQTPKPTETSEPVETPEPTRTLEPTQTPKNNLPLAGYKIGIDPGHQRHGNYETEPCAPGSDEMKAKVSSGTEGIYTHIPEYQVNLDVGLLLRDMLEDLGATVIMTRTTNDVDISNIERAKIFNREETDYALRLHCDGKDDQSVHGAFMLVPTKNPYLDDCKTAAQLLIDAYCEETGARNMGLTYRSDQTGFNWCERMIINIEMGHLSNKEEDIKLTSPEYQKKMARGLANGILLYFQGKQ